MATAGLVLGTGAGVVLAAPPAQAAPTCLGHTATIVGTAGRDHLVGTEHRDVIVGLGGADRIEGRGGSDLVCAGGGSDVVQGEDGADLLDGGRGADYLVGGAGDDLLLGGDGNDRLTGEEGRDRLRGQDGGDDLDGGPGGDRLDGGRNSPWGTIRGGIDDVLDGQDGDDVLTAHNAHTRVLYELAPRRVVVDLGAGTADGWGHDRLVGVHGIDGTPYDDRLVGGPQADVIDGKAGDDVILTHGGADSVIDLYGTSTVRSGAGADFVQVVGRRSVAHLGSGPDAGYGSKGAAVYGDAGADSLVPEGYAVLDGGPGSDTVDLIDSAGPVTIDLAARRAGLASGRLSPLTGIENGRGSQVADVLTGDEGPNVLDGQGGDDLVTGAGGDDTLLGDFGEDTLTGGDGIDSVDGGDGTDTCSGEALSSCESIACRVVPRSTGALAERLAARPARPVARC